MIMAKAPTALLIALFLFTFRGPSAAAINIVRSQAKDAGGGVVTSMDTTTMVLQGASVTTDIFVGSSYPDQSWDGSFLEIDTADYLGHKWAFVKFDIPVATANVISAQLQVFITNEGNAGHIHEMIVDWNAQSTFSSLGMTGTGKGNVGIWDPVVQATVPGPGIVGNQVVDVTSSVQKWLSGQSANYGWVFEPTGGNGMDFYSSSSVAGLEPKLTIEYQATTTTAAQPQAQMASGVAAKGDPHLKNMYGQRFDVNQPGDHVLVQIPRAAPPSKTFLRLQARAEQVGGACADMYFRALNITGAWVSGGRGMHFSSSSAMEKKTEWINFGVVKVKVVRAHTDTGVAYLNIMLKNLGAVPFPVGGLLGQDDHTKAAAQRANCGTRLSL